MQTRALAGLSRRAVDGARRAQSTAAAAKPFVAKKYKNATPTPFPTKFHPTFSANNAQPVLPVGLTFNPPPAAPSPYDTPGLFLPADEQAKRAVVTPALDGPLPPALTTPAPKGYHLGEADVAEIRRLRAADPVKNSRTALAAQFKCSPFFIGMVAPASEERKDEMAKRLSAIQQSWGPLRRKARLQRQKRRELVARDD
ncbi:mitochondrial 54S ribosomal protein mL58 [Dipodascopsis tothii]|uniref:mitochondrial 54S ribosomal protein mL58 n=1 Tax=Dipodascopsis tothii TaxID=44089 RepID=UPI0034CEAFCC